MAFAPYTTTQKPPSKKEQKKSLSLHLINKYQTLSPERKTPSFSSAVKGGAKLLSNVVLGGTPDPVKATKQNWGWVAGKKQPPSSEINAQIPFFFAKPRFGLKPGFYGFGDANQPGEVSELMTQTVGKALARANLFDSANPPLNPLPKGISPEQRAGLLLDRTGAAGKLPPKMDRVGPLELFKGRTIAAMRSRYDELKDDIPDMYRDVFGPEAGSQSSIGAFPDIGFKLRRGGPSKAIQPIGPDNPPEPRFGQLPPGSEFEDIRRLFGDVAPEDDLTNSLRSLKGPGKGIRPTENIPPDAPFPSESPKFGPLPPSSEFLDMFLGTQGLKPLDKYERSDLMRNIVGHLYNNSDRALPPSPRRAEGIVAWLSQSENLQKYLRKNTKSIWDTN